MMTNRVVELTPTLAEQSIILDTFQSVNLILKCSYVKIFLEHKNSLELSIQLDYISVNFVPTLTTVTMSLTGRLKFPMTRPDLSILETYPYAYQILATSLFGFVLLLFRKVYLKRRNPKGLPLPPGPKGYPIIGNLLDFPIDHQWMVYDKWTKKYGKYIS